MFWNFNRTVIGGLLENIWVVSMFDSCHEIHVYMCTSIFTTLADLTPDAILAQFKSLPTATMSSLVGGLTLNAKEELIDATAMRATYFGLWVWFNFSDIEGKWIAI